MAGPHCRVELFGLRFVNQGHRALGDALMQQKILLAAGDHVDNGVSEGENIEFGGHGVILMKWLGIA